MKTFKNYLAIFLDFFTKVGGTKEEERPYDEWDEILKGNEYY